MLSRVQSLWRRALDPSRQHEVCFAIVRRIAALIMPEYRLGWPQLEWWQDESFNQYLDRFNELDGLNTGRRWTVWQLTRLVAAIPGDTAECGVFEGAGSYLIAAGAGQHGHERTHHVFDSFEGLSEPGVIDGTSWRKGNMACGFDVVEANLAPFPNVRYHRGWIPDTFQSVAGVTFAFVHIDVDLYQPTRESIRFFYERMSCGGIVVCDDYGFTTCPGATQAVDEFLADRPEKMISLPGGGGFFIKGVATAQCGDLTRERPL